MSGFLHLWPAEASAYSGQVDMLVLAFTALIICLSAPVFILIVVFAVKYRRGKPADRTHPVNQRMGWEVSWALIPFLLIIFFYVWSTRLFFDAHEMKPGALGIDVVAKQWMWKFQHPGGQREINELHVPAGSTAFSSPRCASSRMCCRGVTRRCNSPPTSPATTASPAPNSVAQTMPAWEAASSS
jgi:cytochrome c oxidase subunit 2